MGEGSQLFTRNPRENEPMVQVFVNFVRARSDGLIANVDIIELQTSTSLENGISLLEHGVSGD
jgi:hypothetical protein